MKADDDDDFGEGETEDTQLVKNDVEWRVDTKLVDDRMQKIEEPLYFKSPHDPKLLQSYPQRTRTEIADTKIVFSSDFCSGNLDRVQKGFNKNCYDLWVAADSAPFLEGDFYKTWFYFSVTGVPQGEQLTFTFKNLNNQVSYFPKTAFEIQIQPGNL